MRVVNGSVQAAREARGALSVRTLVTIEAKERSTGNDVEVSFSSHDETVTLAPEDMWTGLTPSRTFYGAGAILGISPIRHFEGLEVRPIEIEMSDLDGDVAVAMREYEPRAGRVQIHRWYLHPGKRTTIGIEPWFKGQVDKFNAPRPPAGGTAKATVRVLPFTRFLSLPARVNWSHESLQSRNGDGFLKHAAAMADLELDWGQESREDIK